MHFRKQIRKNEAEERQAECAKRSPQEQLQRLNAKLGPGVGAKRERALLAKRVGEGSE
jgi:hypothetical protein